MVTFQKLEEFARTARIYRSLRADMKFRAKTVYRFIKDEDRIERDLEQYTCRHEFVINEETDRCYCSYCGLDGDA